MIFRIYKTTNLRSIYNVADEISQRFKDRFQAGDDLLKSFRDLMRDVSVHDILYYDEFKIKRMRYNVGDTDVTISAAENDDVFVILKTGYIDSWVVIRGTILNALINPTEILYITGESDIVNVIKGDVLDDNRTLSNDNRAIVSSYDISIEGLNNIAKSSLLSVYNPCVFIPQENLTDKSFLQMVKENWPQDLQNMIDRLQY